MSSFLTGLIDGTILARLTDLSLSKDPSVRAVADIGRLAVLRTREGEREVEALANEREGQILRRIEEEEQARMRDQSKTILRHDNSRDLAAAATDEYKDVELTFESEDDAVDSATKFLTIY
jgi:hypothetical protein